MGWNRNNYSTVLLEFKITFRKSNQFFRLFYVVQSFCRQRLLIKLLHAPQNKLNLSCFSGSKNVFFLEMQVLQNYSTKNKRMFHVVMLWSKVLNSLVYLELCGGDKNRWQGLKFVSYRRKPVANLNPVLFLNLKVLLTILMNVTFGIQFYIQLTWWCCRDGNETLSNTVSFFINYFVQTSLISQNTAVV